jgi:hypothetical protein
MWEDCMNKTVTIDNEQFELVKITIENGRDYIDTFALKPISKKEEEHE